MRISNLLVAAAVSSTLVATPALAASANPAASLSLANASSVKATSKGKKANGLTENARAGVVLLGVAAAAGIVYVATKEDSDSK